MLISEKSLTSHERRLEMVQPGGLQEVVAAAMFGCFVQVSCRFPADFFLKCCNGTELEYISISSKYILIPEKYDN